MNKISKETRLFIGFVIAGILLMIIFNRFSIATGIDNLSLWLYPQSVERRGMAIDLMLKTLGAIAIGVGLWFGLVRAYASKKSADAQTKAIENQTEELKLSREIQIAELFKVGVEHLASPTESIAISGVFELQTIAEQNKDNFSLFYLIF